MKKVLLVASVLMASLSPMIAHTSYSAGFNSIIQAATGWWKCRHCGSENPDDAAYCNGCARAKGWWKCHHCGSENPDAAVYCNGCDREK